MRIKYEIRNTQYTLRNTNMAWTQIKIRILGNSTNREGSLSKRMLFIWCMLASVIFYLAPQNFSNKFQLTFAHVFRIPLSASRSVSISAGAQQRHNDTVPREEYEKLQNRYDNLRQQLNEQIDDFNRLTNLNSYVGENVDYILGKVIIPAEADSRRSDLIIECSGITGLEEGRFVLAENYSIIGRITDILPQFKKAKVQLITDPDSKIAVQIEGLDMNLFMQGNGDDTAKIGTVSKELEIKIGQKVYATNKNEFLEYDMIVGTISNLKQDDKAPTLWDITVKPAWEMEDLFKIAVIIEKQQQ